MTTKTLIFMNIAYLNGNFDGKLAKNLADGSVGRGGDFCPRPLYVTPSDFSLNYREIKLPVVLPNAFL